jgi:hypothetical protein
MNTTQLSFASNKLLFHHSLQAQMLDCHPTYVPIHEGVIFEHVMDIVLVDPTPYRQLVGKLLYFLRMHFNIAYVVNVVS